MNRTRYHLSRMDCSSEERLVRMALDGMAGIERLDFDLDARTVDIFHEGAREAISAALEGLDLGAKEVERLDGVPAVDVPAPDSSERRPLIGALVINAVLFVGELAAGVAFASMGLVADSLDMLADALVYALSLAAVGSTRLRKTRLAAWSGYLQLALALFGLVEVVRRFIAPEERPEVSAMVVVSLVALAGNVATLWLLRGARRGEAHIEASWIFTSNDVKVNLLVIVAALLVWWSSSSVPDLIVGGLIFVIVAHGARRILALARQQAPSE